MAIIAVFNVSPIYGILTASGMVLGAGYMLVMYKRTMFGEITNPEVNTMKDLYKTERVTLYGFLVHFVCFGNLSKGSSGNYSNF